MSNRNCIELQGIRSGGDCFYDAVYQSAKHENILNNSHFPFYKNDMERNEFSKKLRYYISNNLTWEEFASLKNTINNADGINMIPGFRPNNSVGATFINKRNVDITFEKFKENIIKNGMYVTQFEVKTLGKLLNNKNGIPYINRHDYQVYSYNSHEESCQQYQQGRLNIWTDDTHYRAVGKKQDKNSQNASSKTPWKDFSIPEEDFYKSKKEHNKVREQHNIPGISGEDRNQNSKARKQLGKSRTSNTFSVSDQGTKAINSTNQQITLLPSFFVGRNQQGDFLWEIQQKDKSCTDNNTLYIFNDNMEDHMTPIQGGGNAAIRPYNQYQTNEPKCIRSAGVITGSLHLTRGGFTDLYTQITLNNKTETCHIIIDRSLSNISTLLNNGNYTHVKYSAGSRPTKSNPFPVLGNSIFILGEDVKIHIIKKLQQIIKDINDKKKQKKSVRFASNQPPSANKNTSPNSVPKSFKTKKTSSKSKQFRKTRRSTTHDNNRNLSVKTKNNRKTRPPRPSYQPPPLPPPLSTQTNNYEPDQKSSQKPALKLKPKTLNKKKNNQPQVPLPDYPSPPVPLPDYPSPPVPPRDYPQNDLLPQGYNYPKKNHKAWEVLVKAAVDSKRNRNTKNRPALKPKPQNINSQYENQNVSRRVSVADRISQFEPPKSSSFSSTQIGGNTKQKKKKTKSKSKKKLSKKK
jgi:hypothetical protein